MKLFTRAAIFGISLLTTPFVHAAFITTQEAALDSIYSQATFGQNIIDIRIGTATELVFPELLDITTRAEVSQLFSQHVGPSNVVNFYFIDTISACGSQINRGIVGCGEYFGNDFVVESSYAAGSLGGELLAHELGHNLGLPHLSGAYLMNPSLNNRTLITEPEVERIFRSPLVQNDNDYFWIDINPVLIVAEATRVSEPASVFLFAGMLGMLVWRKRERRTLSSIGFSR
ncbi:MULTISPECIES: PEP-CTERM sorting domain-containing protein [unclassified Agarivorans]|uniref:PEP-CTERM sorting domain-containing protein n=1 Tax=unclassified Agarivorans TaxID=2636026 RepID=UPI0026E16B2D|nr:MULTISPECIES: PEP-CTERM sorting domain-containing protein [unclassified Agarivorans]MDO6687566.1 PEP-CTERM sorting domain-containing protein [Agarivorans sp. 3_MG-2023]MDO6717101.1 PEP-CTERM sorting domain-containing protein [Agarivorans sp. 2_MG-2023]